MSHSQLPSLQLALGSQQRRPPLKPFRAKSLPTSPSRSRRTSPRVSPYPSPHILSTHLEDGSYVDLTDLDNFEHHGFPMMVVAEPEEYFPLTAYDPEKVSWRVNGHNGGESRYQPPPAYEGPRGFFDVLMVVWTGIQVVFGCAMGLVALAGGSGLCMPEQQIDWMGLMLFMGIGDAVASSFHAYKEWNVRRCALDVGFTLIALMCFLSILHRPCSAAERRVDELLFALCIFLRSLRQIMQLTRAPSESQVES